MLPENPATYLEFAGGAGGDTGGAIAPCLAQGQDCRRQEKPSGDLDQVAEAKQQDENQQPAERVLEDPDARPGATAVAANG